MAESLALRLARQKVDSYTGEVDEVLRRHYEAMDCVDCEAYLQLGIDAFRWLVWADEAIRRGVYAGKAEYDSSVDGALRSLLVAWLQPRDFAEKWIEVQRTRGFEVDNADEFRRCCEEVQAIVRSFEDRSLPEAMARLRDRALADYRDGKTTEFLEGV
jgi:hypothetical protein